MNGSVTVARPIVDMQEGNYYRPCLIGFAKRPWLKKKIEYKDHRVEYKIIQYQHHLYLNLWLIELDIEWLGSISE